MTTYAYGKLTPAQYAVLKEIDDAWERVWLESHFPLLARASCGCSCELCCHGEGHCLTCVPSASS